MKPDEETPLLDKRRESDSDRRQSDGSYPFQRAPSIRGSIAFPYFTSSTEASLSHSVTPGSDVNNEKGSPHFKELVEPIEALSPLVFDGTIVVSSPDGNDIVASRRPPSLVKSIPAKAPYRRNARHRSFKLWWINEFRHWWKSSRLLVRLAGLDVTMRATMGAMVLLRPQGKHQGKFLFKTVKRLGQGGNLGAFLSRCHPFTRSVRLLVGIWRWIEAAKCRRLEVGVEEVMGFVGNRVSRMVSRLFVDRGTKLAVWPLVNAIFGKNRLSIEHWHPAMLIIFLGVLRATLPFALSFQGSRAGRVLSKAFFRNLFCRWEPIQRAERVNLNSDDCAERDEVDENADVVRLAKKVAKALGRVVGQGGDMSQNDALTEEGFRQVGAGSGGYAVYECHRRVSVDRECENLTLLLHVTPFGPSICDSLPRYCVLEVEDSQDRRAAWSNFIDSWSWKGPSVVEGYVYQGAFFSPYHFAALKHSYDKQLTLFEEACRALAKDRNNGKTGPPTDQLGLKTFLTDGKAPRQRKKSSAEAIHLKMLITKVANRLKSMMNPNNMECKVPKGIILYFEGLDCSGKSSTGGLLQKVLEETGFEVEVRQYNRPPTDEQKLQLWMNRFKIPDMDSSFNGYEEKSNDGDTESVSIGLPLSDGGIENDEGHESMKPANCIGHKHRSLVWDRGPAGDFVYGSLSDESEEVKQARYEEFMEFERDCRRRGILLCKFMFVTNRDSIAATLGKRLAQRVMTKDLRVWLNGNRGHSEDNSVGMDGLDEIDKHIDPTDFAAFNRYQKNLFQFINFAINTDSRANPWVVVNTTERFSARKQLLDVFQMQVSAFGKKNDSENDDMGSPNLGINDMLTHQTSSQFRLGTLVTLMIMLLLLGAFCEHTKIRLFHIEWY